MANQLFKNNAGATLNGTIAIGNTTINIAAGQGARFPAPTAGDYFLLTIYEKDVGGVEFNYEVVKCTARTADTLTVVRDFEGLVVAGGGTSDGWAYPSSVGLNPSQIVYLDLRYTAYACGNTLVKDDNLASLASAATARTNLGLGNVENKTFAVGTADATHAATSKTTPVDADEIPMADSAASWGLKKLTWANVKATLLSWLQSTVFPAPGPIGGTTPGSGAFSTLVSGSDASLAGAFGDVAVSQSIVTGGAAQFAGYRFSANTGGANLYLYKSRGASVGINTIVQSGDILGSLNFAGADGVTYHRAAIIAAEVDGTPGTNDMPGRLVFSTTADGASSPTARYTIASDGKHTYAGYAALTNTTANAAFTITNTGAGNSFVVEDSASTDSTPFVIDASGIVLQGKATKQQLNHFTDGAPYQMFTAGALGPQYGAFSADAFGPNFFLAKSRNATIGSNTVVQSGDLLGTFQFFGADGTGFIRAAQIDAVVDGTPGTNDMPGRLVFSTTADGASTPTERMRIDSSGNVLVTNPAGLGYGVGAGGTVTQATSKSTAVTLNKPCGQITMNNAALAAGAMVEFNLNNSLLTINDVVVLTMAGAAFTHGNYELRFGNMQTGIVTVYLKNTSASPLSEAVVFNFAILKAATT